VVVKDLSDGEASKTEVIDLKKFGNFVVHNLFVWSRYAVPLFDSQDFIEVNTNYSHMFHSHKWVYSDI
jgi:hypothetical protein